MIVFEILAALLFIGSSGVLFNAKFRTNVFLVTCTGLIAIISTCFLMKETVELVVNEEISKRLSNGGQDEKLPVQTTAPANDQLNASTAKTPITPEPAQTAQPGATQSNANHATALREPIGNAEPPHAGSPALIASTSAAGIESDEPPVITHPTEQHVLVDCVLPNASHASLSKEDCTSRDGVEFH